MKKIKIPSKEEKVIESLKVENEELSNYMLDVDMRLVMLELGIQ